MLFLGAHWAEHRLCPGLASTWEDGWRQEAAAAVTTAVGSVSNMRPSGLDGRTGRQVAGGLPSSCVDINRLARNASLDASRAWIALFQPPELVCIRPSQFPL